MENLHNLRILVVEDDTISMMIASKILEARQAVVSKAANGKEALQILSEAHNTDLVLLDLEMPEMDGYKTIQKIREGFPDLPVIACTAAVLDKQMKLRLKQMGFTDTIPKPFIPQLFYEIIFAVLEERKSQKCLL